MSFDVKIIEDSLSPRGKRLTTITATYPRFIHSEIMTHRDRARNAASSRAIPFPVMCQRIEADPVVPLMWPHEQSGMQGGHEIPEHLQEMARSIWREAMADATKHAKRLHNIGATYLAEANYTGQPDIEYHKSIKIHKSLPNRIIEPWMWITIVMTATEWANFFRLRCHPDAEIHFQKIAGMIRDAMQSSTPRECKYGDWHLPFIQPDEYGNEIEVLAKASTARCARVSYLTHEGVRDIGKDIATFDRLCQGSGFGHWSPHEHVAQAMESETFRSGPFIGWRQFRKQFANENLAG